MGTEALLKFALLLGVEPTDIRPEFALTPKTRDDLSPEAIQDALTIDMLNADEKKALRLILNGAFQQRKKKPDAA